MSSFGKSTLDLRSNVIQTNRLVANKVVANDLVAKNATIDNLNALVPKITKKFVAGEPITKGSCVSILKNLIYNGFGDAKSSTITTDTVNFLEVALMSENNFVLVVAMTNIFALSAFQIGMVYPITYDDTKDSFLIGSPVSLPTTGTSFPGRISNAFDIESLDNTRFSIVYQDTSGSGTTATINRLVTGSFTPGVPPSTVPIVTFFSGSTQTYGTSSHTIVQSGTTITGTLTSFTSDMVGMNIRYTSGPSSGTVQLITGFSSSTSITTDTPLNVAVPSQFEILYSTSQATQSGNIVTGLRTIFTSSMVGSQFTFIPGTARTITAFNSPTSITIGGPVTTVSTPTDFTINYITGTISQSSGGTITGVGTTFTPEMVGGLLTVTSGPSKDQTRLITAFTSPTVITTPANTAIAAGANFSLAYKLGTVSQTTTTITGRSTLFTAAMNRGIFQYTTVALGQLIPPPTTTVAITAFTNSTTLTTPTSQTAIAGQTFSLAYSNGTVGQTGNVVTGTGTAFTNAMVGGILTFTSGASSGTQVAINTVTNATTITVSTSLTVASGTTFSVSFGQTRFSPQINPSVAIGTQRNFRIRKVDTDVTIVGYRDGTNFWASFWTVTYSGLNATVSSAFPTIATSSTNSSSVVSGFEIMGVNPTQFLAVYNDRVGAAIYVLGETASPPSSGPPILQPAGAFGPPLQGIQSLYYVLSKLQDNQLILFFQDQANSGRGTSLLFSITGNEVSVGSKYTFYPGSLPNVLCFTTLVVNPNKVVHFFVDVPNGSIGRSVIADISNSVISFNDLQTFDLFNPNPFCGSINTSNKKMFIFFRDSFDNTCQSIVTYIDSSNEKLLIYNVNKGLRCLGIAQTSAASAGEIVEVLFSGISDVHSNLLPNEDYFSHGNGSLLQFADSLDRTYLTTRVGISISDTSIAVRFTN